MFDLRNVVAYIAKRVGLNPAPGLVWRQWNGPEEIQCEILAAETREVADAARVGRRVKTFADGSQEVTEGDMVDPSRLMVDTRKWLLSKMFPKKYGDKVATEVSGVHALEGVSRRLRDGRAWWQ